METFDPDEYVIAVVQIPPGQTSASLLDVGRRSTAKCLRKFFRKLVDPPSTPLSKRLPSIGQDAERFALSMKEIKPVYLPFVGRGCENGWFFRHLLTFRLTIEPYSMTSSPTNLVPMITHSGLGESHSPSDPFSDVPLPMSPQLVTSSDEDKDENLARGETESGIPPIKKRKQ